jgi:hypothetical protein
MKSTFRFGLIGLVLITTSCGSNGTKSATDQLAAPKAAGNQMMASHTKKYGIKSGIITFTVETNLMEEKQVKKVYFDEFGTRETSEKYKKNILVEKMINKADGYVYQLAVDRNSGIRSKHAMATGTEMKFDLSDSAWPDNMKKQYNYGKLANENICGKDCEVFTTEFENIKAKYAGWNGILLMIETSMLMGKTTMTTKSVAIKFEENVEIPASVWEIPEGIKLTEH